jgi:hypothetical protein
MIIDWGKMRIFVKPGATDLRKQINGLSVIVSEELKMNVFEGNLFLFCNKLQRILKIIYWEMNGFCQWYLCEASHNVLLCIMVQKTREG